MVKGSFSVVYENDDIDVAGLEKNEVFFKKIRFLDFKVFRFLNFIFCNVLLCVGYLRCRQYVRNSTAALLYTCLYLVQLFKFCAFKMLFQF